MDTNLINTLRENIRAAKQSLTEANQLIALLKAANEPYIEQESKVREQASRLAKWEAALKQQGV